MGTTSLRARLDRLERDRPRKMVLIMEESYGVPTYPAGSIRESDDGRTTTLSVPRHDPDPAVEDEPESRLTDRQRKHLKSLGENVETVVVRYVARGLATPGGREVDDD